MAEIKSTGANATPSAAAVVQRLHQYPGCRGYVLRWCIQTDAFPRPYRTEEEAAAEIERRQRERRAP